METRKKLFEGNKLIAQFMNLPIPPQARHGDMNFWRFHKSWDALMPVIVKVQEHEMYSKYVDEHSNILTFESMIGSLINPKHIESTYCDIIDIIQWYNENK